MVNLHGSACYYERIWTEKCFIIGTKIIYLPLLLLSIFRVHACFGYSLRPSAKGIHSFPLGFKSVSLYKICIKLCIKLCEHLNKMLCWHYQNAKSVSSKFIFYLSNWWASYPDAILNTNSNKTLHPRQLQNTVSSFWLIKVRCGFLSSTVNYCFISHIFNSFTTFVLFASQGFCHVNYIEYYGIFAACNIKIYGQFFPLYLHGLFSVLMAPFYQFMLLYNLFFFP